MEPRTSRPQQNRIVTALDRAATLALTSQLNRRRLDVGFMPAVASRGTQVVTICVASLCVAVGSTIIVCAADQMMTTGDSEFEPYQAKFWTFTPSVSALIAGDNPAQITICARAHNRIASIPGISVEECAIMYAEEFQNYRRISAEANLLKPLGLDSDSFIYRQKEMDQSVVLDLTNKLISRDIDASTIIVGRDNTGHHIFAIHDPGEVYCADGIGFCAVGTGRRHAEAQFMTAGYSKHMAWERALLLTYRAKKRAEVSPGVGARTNMFIVAETFSEIDSVVFRKIADSYKRLDEVIESTIDEEEKALAAFLPDYLRNKQQSGASAQAASQPSPTTEPPPEAASDVTPPEAT
jgi:hypothetical protein